VLPAASAPELLPIMANRLIRSPLARLDLIEIWQFLADNNEAAADRFLDRIEHSLLALRDNPLAGRARPELTSDIRSFAVGNYILFYRPLADGIELVRVLNGYQDIQPEDVD
jgi:toxin ParE1/3/4